MSDVGVTHTFPAQTLPVQSFAEASQQADVVRIWTSQRPVPVVVQLGSFSNVKPLSWSDPRHPVVMLAQYITQPDGRSGDGARNGYARIRYGTRAAQQQRYVDLRPGSIQLPPCTFCEVGLRRWNDSAAPAVADEVQVALSIAPGVVAPDTPMPTCSVDLGQFAGGSSNVGVIVPPGARYVQVSPFEYLPGADVQIELQGCGNVDLSVTPVPVQWPSHAAWVPTIRGSQNLNVLKRGTGTARMHLRWEIAL